MALVGKRLPDDYFQPTDLFEISRMNKPIWRIEYTRMTNELFTWEHDAGKAG